MRDYDRALQLEPALAQAALNRGLLHYRAHRLLEAEEDIRRALNGGVDAAIAYYDLALVAVARADTEAARHYAWCALRENPDNRQARELSDSLRTSSRSGKNIASHT